MRKISIVLGVVLAWCCTVQSAAQPAQVEIACLGDSITYYGLSRGNESTGYCYRLREDYDFITQAWKYGYGGRTSKEFVSGCGKGEPTGCVDLMLNRLNCPYPTCRPLIQPKLVVLLVGVNDLYLYHDNDGQTTVEEYYRNLKEIIGRIRKDGRDVIVSTLPPCNNPNWQCKDGDTTRIEERNNVIRRVSDELDVPYADIFTEVFNARFNPLQFQDALHPTAEAHREMAEVYARTIMTRRAYSCSDNPGTCYDPTPPEPPKPEPRCTLQCQYICE